MNEGEQKVIVLVGMPGAGKSSCVEFMEQKGWPSVYLGGIVVDEVNDRGLEVNEVNEKMVREELRAQGGMGVMADRSIPKIDALFEQGNNTVIADGMYSWAEYKIFKEKYGKNAVIIAITAPRQLRHERLAKRPIRPFTEEQVTSREYAEIENIEKGGPIANADFTLVNESDIHSMIADLKKLLAHIGVL